jgi:cell wall-associated NlpC family hydrolase
MHIRTIIIVCAILFSSGSQAEEHTDALKSADPIGIEQVVLKSMPDAVQNVLQYALSHEGASYRMGGSSPENGFDCSGFVRHVFEHVEGLSLPHSASAISQIGNRIKTTELLPGDLVFFRFMRNTISHVGIYLGNNQFIHASSTRSGSVMVSNLTDGYWAKHFALVRRLGSPDDQTTNSNTSEHLSSSPTLRLESKLPAFSGN